MVGTLASHGGYTSLPWWVYTARVARWVYTARVAWWVMYTLVYAGYSTPWVYALLYHPGYTSPVPHPPSHHAGQHSRSGEQALERGVVKLTISDERVSVLPLVPLFLSRFTVGQFPLFPSNLWENDGGREACCAEWSSRLPSES